MFKGHNHSKETREKMSESRKGSNNSNFGNHWKQSDELKALHSKLSSGESNGMYGKTHSDETKAKISASNGGRKWMTDGMHLVHIHPEEIEKYIKLGYHLGMK